MVGVVGGAVVDRRSSPTRKRGWSLVSGTDGNYRNHPKRLRSRPRRSACVSGVFGGVFVARLTTSRSEFSSTETFTR